MWAARVLGALPVLRWPAAGVVVALAVDLGDLVLMNYLPLPQPFDYQAFDKAADLFYLTTFLVVALGWPRLERRVAIGLAAWRAAGVGIFEVTGTRAALLAFPNLFEVWFILVVARDRLRPGFAFDLKSALGWTTALGVAKLGQEYLLHVDRRLDEYVLREVIERLLGGPRPGGG